MLRFQKAQNKNNNANLIEDAAYGPQTQSAPLPALRLKREMEAVKLPFKEITTPQRSNLAKILEEKPDDLIALALDQIQQPLARETVIDSQPKQPLLNSSFVTDPLSANAANIQSTAGSSSDPTNHPATPGHGYLLARSSQIGGPHPRPVFPRHPLGRDRYRQDDALSPNRGNPAGPSESSGTLGGDTFA